MHIFLIAFAGLSVLIAAAVFSRRTGIAAPLLLLGLGMAIGATPWVGAVDIEPELILAGVLPPLLYASSTQMHVLDLRRNMGMIVWLSIVMVIATALVIGAAVHWLFPQIPLALAIALGAVVSPTDAVAATAIGKRLGLPHRIMSILEGESLFNDAAALVTLGTAVAALGAQFSFPQAVGAFVWSTLAGIAVGWLVGRLAVAVRSRLHDPVLSTTVSFTVPWVAFFPAEEVHASGVLAVVVAGVFIGQRGRTRLTATERATESTTWASVSFVLEHALFLVMGLQLSTLVAEAGAESGMGQVWPICAVVFVLLGVLRVFSVAVPAFLQRARPRDASRLRERLSLKAEQLRDLEEQERITAEDAASFRTRLDATQADLDFARHEPITRRGGTVLAWAGMRGVVTVAAAQTIAPMVGGAPVPYRATIVLVAFIVAVATLLLFGGTLPWVIRALKFESPDEGQARAEVMSLYRDIVDRAVTTLGPLAEQEIDGRRVSPEAVKAVERAFVLLHFVSRGREGRPKPPTDIRHENLVLQQRYLEEFRAALAHEQVVGAYSVQALTQAQEWLDGEEQRLGRFR